MQNATVTTNWAHQTNWATGNTRNAHTTAKPLRDIISIMHCNMVDHVQSTRLHAVWWACCARRPTDPNHGHV
eukprot:2170189-Lingulodinium_polyedra.AAC.1